MTSLCLSAINDAILESGFVLVLCGKPAENEKGLVAWIGLGNAALSAVGSLIIAALICVYTNCTIKY